MAAASAIATSPFPFAGDASSALTSLIFKLPAAMAFSCASFAAKPALRFDSVALVSCSLMSFSWI